MNKIELLNDAENISKYESILIDSIYNSSKFNFSKSEIQKDFNKKYFIDIFEISGENITLNEKGKEIINLYLKYLHIRDKLSKIFEEDFTNLGAKNNQLFSDYFSLSFNFNIDLDSIIERYNLEINFEEFTFNFKLEEKINNEEKIENEIGFFKSLVSRIIKK